MKDNVADDRARRKARELGLSDEQVETLNEMARTRGVGLEDLLRQLEVGSELGDVGEELPGADLSVRTRRRHDAGYVPRGYSFDRGLLVTHPEEHGEPTQRDILTAESVMGTLTMWLRETLTDPEDIRRVSNWPRRRPANPLLADPEVRRGLAIAFEAIFGHPPGENWRSCLAEAIEHDLLLRERDRLRTHDGWPRGRIALVPHPTERFALMIRERTHPEELFPDEIELASDPEERELHEQRGAERVVEHVRALSKTPAELTVEVVERALRETSLGGGRGGKTPRRWVEDFAKGLKRSE